MTSTHSNFARIFSSYHDQYSEAGPSNRQIDTPIRYDAVLDEQGGLVTALMANLEERIREDPSSSMDNEFETGYHAEREGLLLEHRTWHLLRSIYLNQLPREEADFEPIPTEEAVNENPYMTPGDAAGLIVDEDDELSLWATLIDHLQTRPFLNHPPPLEARHGYLPSTLRRAKTQKQTNSNTLKGKSLDPDFVLREGAGLAGEDQTYQQPLLKTLFDHVRYGELDQAVKICEMGGEPWRGASIMGGRRWTLSGLADGQEGETVFEGNKRRMLWKKSCKAIAKNPMIPQAERNLYAALTSSISLLNPICNTWEDQLWAHLQSRLESRIDARWKELGSFWNDPNPTGNEGDEMFESGDGGLEEIFGMMQNNPDEAVQTAFRNPYYVAQRMIILNRTESLISQFANQVEGLELKIPQELVGPLVRFFTHLILFLRVLNQPVPETASNVIIQYYLRVLESEGQDDLVAVYAACLREGNGEDSYARFLQAMDRSATKETKMEALQRAKTHNLDVVTIARETVRLILEESFAAIPSLSKDQPDMISLPTSLTEDDVYVIRSTEWLLMNQETMVDALLKSNDIGRYFLALGRANAAKALLNTLPANITSYVKENEDEEYHLMEYTDMLRLFIIFANYENVQDILSKKPKLTATKLEQHNWRKTLSNAINKTHESTVELLVSDWMMFPISSQAENASQRKKELRRIRQIFIPDLVLQLHHLLISQSSIFPNLIQTALDLTKIIAKEDNHVYEEFFSKDGDSGKLAVYLERVREVAMEALKISGTNPFKIASN